MAGNTATSIAAFIVSAVIFRARNRAAFFALSLLALSAMSSLQSAWGAATNAGDFFHSLVGDWIGVCEQSTDGVKAENKYFHATIRQISPCEYQTRFEYFRAGDMGKPVQIGESAVKTNISPDGTASSVITGKGTVLVNNKPKPQEHELKETQTCKSASSLRGVGVGKVNVKNMPLGLGSDGKVRQSTTEWSLKNGVLSIDQKLQVAFSVLLFSKSFSMNAHYTARRGTDVAGLIAHPNVASAAQ